MRETLFRGGSACIPAVPREGLSESLIDPAVAWLQARGCTGGHWPAGRRAAVGAGRVRAGTTDGPMPVEAVVLAVPPWVAADLLPGQRCPTAFQAILNIHFRVEADRGLTGFIGLMGGTAEWVFVKRGHVSVTISAANQMVEQDAETIARAVWPDVQAALNLRGQMPAWRVVKERRATVAATAGTGAAATGAAHGSRQSGARRRLDRHRVARHDRRCHQVRPNRGRSAAHRLRTRHAG